MKLGEANGRSAKESGAGLGQGALQIRRATPTPPATSPALEGAAASPQRVLPQAQSYRGTTNLGPKDGPSLSCWRHPPHFPLPEGLRHSQAAALKLLPGIPGTGLTRAAAGKLGEEEDRSRRKERKQQAGRNQPSPLPCTPAPVRAQGSLVASLVVQRGLPRSKEQPQSTAGLFPRLAPQGPKDRLRPSQEGACGRLQHASAANTTHPREGGLQGPSRCSAGAPWACLGRAPLAPAQGAQQAATGGEGLVPKPLCFTSEECRE